MNGGKEIPPDPALQQDVGHQQEQRYRQKNEAIQGRQDRLGRHQRRETTENEHSKAETAQRERHRHADQQQGEQRSENENCRHSITTAS